MEETKGRKLKSKVWDEFTKYKGEEGIEWAICSTCEKEFDGSSKKGITHLKNHLESRKCRAIEKPKILILVGPDQDKSIKTRDVVAGDIIKQIFNGEGNTIAADDLRSLNSRKVEILRVCEEEKIKLGQFLNKLSCRFSLEKYWLEGDYSLLKLHYIDENWEQQSKIITLLKYTDLENVIEAGKGTCLDWKIDGNVCCVLDFGQLKDNDNQIGKTDSWFSQRGSLPFGAFLRDINDLLSDVDILLLESCAIDRIRRCVDYGYKTTISNKLKLQIAASITNSKGKKATFKDAPLLQNRFNYLKTRVGLKEAFCEVEKIDPYFRSINLSKEKWDEATATFEHLKAFNEHCWYGDKNINIIPIVDFPQLAYIHA